MKWSLNRSYKKIKTAVLKSILDIQIWLDKKEYLGDGLLYKQHLRGKFYVIYPDKKKSMPFDYMTACDYQELFGGEVYHKTGKKIK